MALYESATIRKKPNAQQAQAESSPGPTSHSKEEPGVCVLPDFLYLGPVSAAGNLGQCCPSADPHPSGSVGSTTTVWLD